MRQLLLGLSLLAAATAAAAETPEVLPAWPAAAEVDPYMGNYEGTFSRTGREPAPAEAQVVAEGNGAYRAMLLSRNPDPAGWPVLAELTGRVYGPVVYFADRSLGVEWGGELKDGALTAEVRQIYGGKFELKKFEKTSPTAGLEPPAGATVLLPYEPGTPPSLAAWTNETWAPTADGAMEVGKGENATKEAFGSIRLHLEFCVSYMPDARGQARANSGVFPAGLYEPQVLDSFGFLPAGGDVGSIYRQSAPLVNAALPPLTWQTYDIWFHAAELDDAGNVTRLPRMTVELNGVRTQDEFEMATPTSDTSAPHVAKGKLTLQDHNNPIRFRNIWLVPLDADEPAK